MKGAQHQMFITFHHFSKFEIFLTDFERFTHFGVICQKLIHIFFYYDHFENQNNILLLIYK